MLLYDEESDIVGILKLYIEEHLGRHVEAVQSLSDALHSLQFKPNLLLLNYTLSGDDCEEIIKAARLEYNPKIVIMTAISNTEYLKEKLKPDRILEKPFSLEELDKVILDFNGKE